MIEVKHDIVLLVTNFVNRSIYIPPWSAKINFLR